MAIVFFGVVSIAVTAANLTPSTWVALTPVPASGQVPVFALAVNPTNDATLIAGNGQGVRVTAHDQHTIHFLQIGKCFECVF